MDIKQRDLVNWRSLFTNVIEQQLYMLRNAIETDCSFLVGDVRVFAHSFVLIRCSHVFQESLKSSKEIKLNGVLNTDILNLMLRHLYGEDLSNSTLTIRQIHLLMFAAAEYKINTLLNFTTKYAIERFLNPNNVWTLLETAQSFKNDDLKQKCLQLIDVNLAECLRHCIASAGNITEKTIIYILSQEKLFSLSLNELYIINLIDKWAQIEAQRRKTNIRTVLKNIIPFIRFLLLSINALLTGPAKQWLKPEECIEIIQAISTKEKHTSYPKHFSQSTSVRFATTKITVNFKPLLLANYELLETTQTNENVSTIIFSVNENIYLNEINISPINGKYQHINCEIQEFKDNINNISTSSYFGELTNKGNNPLVKFKTIVPLKVNKIYIIKFTLPNEKTLYKYCKHIKSDIKSIIKIIYELRNYSTNNLGFISDIHVYN